MKAKAQARFVRVTPRKARRVVDVVRGKAALDAVDILRFAPQEAAKDVRKVLESAMANVKYQADQIGERVSDEELRIVEAYVDEGPTMKRFRARAQGRGAQILKRTSHITVIVGTNERKKEVR